MLVSVAVGGWWRRGGRAMQQNGVAGGWGGTVLRLVSTLADVVGIPEGRGIGGVWYNGQWGETTNEWQRTNGRGLLAMREYGDARIWGDARYEDGC
jgi:hypothetical protein